MAQKTAPRSPVKSTATTSTNLRIKSKHLPQPHSIKCAGGYFLYINYTSILGLAKRARSSGNTHILKKKHKSLLSSKKLLIFAFKIKN